MENKDFRQTDLKKGDAVVYITPYFRGLGEGIIMGFTPEMATIMPKGSKFTLNRYKKEIVKIEI